MERLRFGGRARAKAGRKRVLIRLWIVSVIWTLIGLPAFGPADVLDGFTTEPERERIARGIETSESATGLMRFRRGVFEHRPKPTPKPAPAPAPSSSPVTAAVPPAPAGSVSEIIYAAAAEFGIDGSYLLSIAACESGLNPSAQNPSGYYGLFQFDQATWASYGYGSIFDPAAQARTAARLIAAGQASRWPSCA